MIRTPDILGCFYILSICLVLSLSINELSPNGIALKGQWDPQVGVVMPGANKTHAVDVHQINDPYEAKQLVESGTMIVLDVRWPEIYDLGHIPGALNFPLNDLEQLKEEQKEAQKKSLLSKITPKDQILVYCAGVTCHDSHTFASRLVKMGFTHVAVYAGGFDEWEEMGFDVATQGTDQ